MSVARNPFDYLLMVPRLSFVIVYKRWQLRVPVREKHVLWK